MPTLLVVSPHFPPVSAADMHRVRVCLPHFEEFGWRSVVLAVHSDFVERVKDALLQETVPTDTVVHRVRAIPAAWTRVVGVSDLGLRAFAHLYRAGAEIIRRHPVHLVYFSTTVFTTMPLGRVWKAQFGVPFVLDLQDPWVGDYYETKPPNEWPPKYRFARLMHRLLERWTMRAVDGLIAVSDAYPEAVRKRHGRPPADLCRTVTFGASSLDHEMATKLPGDPGFPVQGDGLVHGLYAGALGKPAHRACTAICLALRQGLLDDPETFQRVRLHFVGTDYALDARARKWIYPIAEAMGLGAFVQEQPSRLPYFNALRMLQDAHFLIIPGSDNPGYTASKIYQYILARRPILAVLHERSSATEILRSTNSAEVVAFQSDWSANDIASLLARRWASFLSRLPFEPATRWDLFAPYTARETTRKQCQLFNAILEWSSPQLSRS